MHCARCAITRFLLAPQALTASSRSISNATVANEINAENREGPKSARKGNSVARVRDAPDQPCLSPRGPYRFVNREYLIITYRTDPARQRPRPAKQGIFGALAQRGNRRMPTKPLIPWWAWEGCPLQAAPMP
jgi:hypothetical protein